MNKTILFSPIGGTDPISKYNYMDGSLIHICRVYKPTDVYMYMSSEMIENHKKDNRYIYCLDKISELYNFKMNYHLIERPDLVEVQEYDFFYDEFRKELKKIQDSMDDTDRLLLNISSGTPSMKSALLVIQHLGEFDFTSIQVSTPEKKMNEHSNKDFDFEIGWELNDDNKPNFIKRAKEVKCQSLMKIKKEEIIKKHILAYDYKAALDVANTLSDGYSYTSYIEFAYKRLLLDFDACYRILDKEEVRKILPITNNKYRNCFEYALYLDIKLKQNNYADFIRAISPLIVDLFEQILLNMKIDIDKYTIKGEERKFSSPSMESTEEGRRILSYFNEAYKGYKDSFVKANDLKIIIINESSDQKLIDLVTRLRKVEKNVRNMAAHEIVSVTDEFIKRKTKLLSADIMNDIKEIIYYANMGVEDHHWNSYDEMNKIIIDKMNNK